MKEGHVLLSILLFILISGINSDHKFNCDGHLGVQPDPENCQCFYICSFSDVVHECCNRDELFDAKFLICNHDYLVDCDVRPHPGESTTKRTTTTTTTTTTPTTTTTALASCYVKVIDATTNKLLTNIDYTYTVNGGLEITYPSNGEFTLKVPINSIVELTITRDGFYDKTMSGLIDEDKNWLIVMIPSVKLLNT